MYLLLIKKLYYIIIETCKDCSISKFRTYFNAKNKQIINFVGQLQNKCLTFTLFLF